MTNYGIYISDEPYYGLDAYWKQYANHDEKPSKEQIIKCINSNVDYLSKFIKPSYLLDFSKALSDTLTGDELYANLCENLSYIEELDNKAFSLSKELEKSFYTTVFGELFPYNTKDDCHLMLFPNALQNYLPRLLKSHEEFKSWFIAVLANINKDMFSILINDASVNKVVMKDASLKLENYMKDMSYYESEIKDIKKLMRKELKRLCEVTDLDQAANEIVKKAKKKLEEK